MTRRLNIAASALPETDLETGETRWRARIDMGAKHWLDSAEELWASEDTHDNEDDAQEEAEDVFDQLEEAFLWDAIRSAFAEYENLWRD